MKQRQAEIKLFLYNGKKNSKGEGLIVYLSTFAGEKRRRSTGYFCKPEEWDAVKQKIKGRNYTNYQQANTHMHSQLSRYIDRMNNWNLQNIQYNASKLLDDLDDDNLKYNRNKLDLFYLFDEYINSLYKYSTKRNYQKVKKAIEQFNGKKTLLVTDLDKKWFDDFGKYIKNKGLKDGSIRTYFQTLKAVHNKAVEDGLCKFVSYKYTSLYSNIKPKISLSETQFFQFYSIACNLLLYSPDSTFKVGDKILEMDWTKLEKKINCDYSLEFTLILFCIAYFFQGLALADMSMIKAEDIRITENENDKFYMLNLARSKTNENLTVVVVANDFTETIIESWIKNSVNRAGYLVPILTGKEDTEERIKLKIQNAGYFINKNLKKLAKAINEANKEKADKYNESIINKTDESGEALKKEIPVTVPENLTYYIIRHTFALNSFKKTNNIFLTAKQLGRKVEKIDTYLNELSSTEELMNAARNLI